MAVTPEAPAREIYVSPDGHDGHCGTFERPFATLQRAQHEARRLKSGGEWNGPLSIILREGVYYLDEPLVLTSEDSGTADAPVTYGACGDEKATISGGRRLHCTWRHFRDGIFVCDLPDETQSGRLPFDQLFVNGVRQVRARYPNLGHSITPKRGIAAEELLSPSVDADADAIAFSDSEPLFSGAPPRGIVLDPDTFTSKRWRRPQDAVVHIFQAMYWGNLQFRVQAIDWERHVLLFGEGGTQIGAKFHPDPCKVDHRSKFFIENVLEELDSPHEWYYDREQGRLYYMPPEGLDLERALVEVAHLQRLVEFRGSQKDPVRHVTLSGLRFAHTGATYFETYDIPSLGDWALHRGGAVTFEGTQSCAVTECFFDAVGGNAIFLNNYNRDARIEGNIVRDAGESAVCLVGTQSMTVGSQTPFPFNCRVINNSISRCGVFGKQTAGVFISVAKSITVGHNHIHSLPRAGICINDGTWGGHVVEYNHVHDTCLETSDHGPFNAWGRDRYWCLLHSHGPQGEKAVCHQAGDVLVDQMATVVIRHNLFEERKGWGIDLDDGASNYHVYNNVCIGVSIKLREGALRLIENNIWINCANPPSFHMGNLDNGDRYIRNITVMRAARARPEHDLEFKTSRHDGEVYSIIRPPFDGPWLSEVDHNLFYSDAGEFRAGVVRHEAGVAKRQSFDLTSWQAMGFDRNSLFADPLFVDPQKKDYRVRPDSPALRLGFKNFEMNRFGLLPDFPTKWLCGLESRAGREKNSGKGDVAL